jgi:hypothetical protein
MVVPAKPKEKRVAQTSASEVCGTAWERTADLNDAGPRYLRGKPLTPCGDAEGKLIPGKQYPPKEAHE